MCVGIEGPRRDDDDGQRRQQGIGIVVSVRAPPAACCSLSKEDVVIDCGGKMKDGVSDEHGIRMWKSLEATCFEACVENVCRHRTLPSCFLVSDVCGQGRSYLP